MRFLPEVPDGNISPFTPVVQAVSPSNLASKVGLGPTSTERSNIPLYIQKAHFKNPSNEVFFITSSFETKSLKILNAFSLRRLKRTPWVCLNSEFGCKASLTASILHRWAQEFTGLWREIPTCTKSGLTPLLLPGWNWLWYSAPEIFGSWRTSASNFSTPKWGLDCRWSITTWPLRWFPRHHTTPPKSNIQVFPSIWKWSRDMSQYRTAKTFPRLCCLLHPRRLSSCYRGKNTLATLHTAL